MRGMHHALRFTSHPFFLSFFLYLEFIMNTSITVVNTPSSFYSSYEMVLVQLSAIGKELNRSRVLIQSISENIAISTAEFLYPSHEGWSIVAHMQPIPVADYELVLETADVTANISGFPSLNV